jgi:propionyl-CoA synthetase
VFGAVDSIKGQLPVGLVVLKAGIDQEPEELRADLVRMVRSQIGPIACYRETAIVKRLPKTRSGKILRGTMRAIASGREYRMPSTIDDPVILDEITETLAQMGYPKK